MTEKLKAACICLRFMFHAGQIQIMEQMGAAGEYARARREASVVALVTCVHDVHETLCWAGSVPRCKQCQLAD